MALTVEDGSGLANADSYCSVADADTYLASRGITSWANVSGPDKEIALRNATDYIEMRFAHRFSGYKNSDEQLLSHPRNGKTYLPINLVRACAQYASRAVTTPLIADPVTDASGQVVSSKTEKLGPLEERTDYATSRELFKPYPAADLLLKSLLRPSMLVR